MTRITMTASDILAACAFEAQRIVAAAGQHAAGAPFPDPDAIAGTLRRMTELNDALLALKKIEPANTEAA